MNLTLQVLFAWFMFFAIWYIREHLWIASSRCFSQGPIRYIQSIFELLRRNVCRNWQIKSNNL